MGVGGKVLAEIGHPPFDADVNNMVFDYVLVPCDRLGIGKVKEGGRKGSYLNGVIGSHVLCGR